MELTVDNIKAIFKEEVDASLNIEELSANQDFMDFGVDSLDRSSVFLTIEDEFGVHVPDADIESLRTIEAIIQYVKQKLA